MTSTRLSVVPAATGGCCINKQHFAVDRENVTLHSLYFLFFAYFTSPTSPDDPFYYHHC